MPGPDKKPLEPPVQIPSSSNNLLSSHTTSTHKTAKPPRPRNRKPSSKPPIASANPNANANTQPGLNATKPQESIQQHSITNLSSDPKPKPPRKKAIPRSRKPATTQKNNEAPRDPIAPNPPVISTPSNQSAFAATATTSVITVATTTTTAVSKSATASAVAAVAAAAATQTPNPQPFPLQLPVLFPSSATMGRLDHPQPAAGLQHPQPQQPPSPIGNPFSAQRVHSPLPLSLPSMTPPARTGSSGSSQAHSRHTSVSRGASQPPLGPTSLAAPAGMVMPAPAFPPTHVKLQTKRSTSPERPPVSPITPPQAHVRPEADAPTISTVGTTAGPLAAPASAPTPTPVTAPVPVPAPGIMQATPVATQSVKTAGTRIIISRNGSAASVATSNDSTRPEHNTSTHPQQPTPPEAFLPPRAPLTHNNQQDMTTSAINLPPPMPIDFETNPDAIALQNAIAILQMQARRAQADMVSLQRAKNDALANPEAFVRDLQSGAVKMANGLMPGETHRGETIPSYDDSSSSSSSSDDDDDDDHPVNEIDVEMANDGNPTPEGAPRQPKPKKQKPPKPAWANIPGEQNIVRCPPINWSQYAVVGDSLNKLAAEQVARPNSGAPAVFTPGAGNGGGGAYEFRGTGGPGERYLGVAAPYVPGRDVLPDKRRGGSRVIAGGSGSGSGSGSASGGRGRNSRGTRKK